MTNRTLVLPLRALLALLAGVLAVLALLPGHAEARKPIVAYLDANGAFALYDAETRQPLPSPIPTNVKRFAVSHDGRYYVYVDAQNKLHLFDARAGAEVPLPGIDVVANPGFPSVSNTGLIAFDENANGPTRVYDSRAGAFVDTGLPADNEQRMPELSGDGRLLVTNGFDANGMTATFAQDVAAKQDTAFPQDMTSGDEHPCTDGDGSLVGTETVVDNNDGNNMNDRDLFIYDRVARAPLSLPGLNDPANSDLYCVLDAGGEYVGVSLDKGNDYGFRLYERATQSFVDLGVAIPGTAQGSVALIQPPPPAPAPSGGSRPAPATASVSRLAAKGALLTFALDRAATVRVEVGVRVRKRGRTVFRALRTRTVKGRAGVNRVRIAAKGLRPGAYVVRVTPAGGTPRSVGLRIRA